LPASFSKKASGNAQGPLTNSNTSPKDQTTIKARNIPKKSEPKKRPGNAATKKKIGKRPRTPFPKQQEYDQERPRMDLEPDPTIRKVLLCN
jgi:hypothetical protein